MGIWNGDDILVRNLRCGCRLWLSSETGKEGLEFHFFGFEIIGSKFWKGDEVRKCEHGNELHPFRHKVWLEA